MKKLFKMTMILLILIFGIQFQMNMCYARLPDDDAKEQKKVEQQQESESITSGSGWDYGTNKWNPGRGGDEPTLVNKANTILVYIRNIGIIISVIALMVIGFKTMVGSIEEKSQYKQSLPIYVLGVIMVVAVTILPSIIYEFVTKIKY